MAVVVGVILSPAAPAGQFPVVAAVLAAVAILSPAAPAGQFPVVAAVVAAVAILSPAAPAGQLPVVAVVVGAILTPAVVLDPFAAPVMARPSVSGR